MANLVFADSPNNFSTAKKMAVQLFKDNPTTLYCGCKFDAHKKIDLKSCNMQQASHIKRAHRLEWGHMMPAENFGRHFQCWREKICKDRKGRAYKGRKCCEKIDANFKKVEAELYNLWPAVGVINQKRSNYRYSPMPGTHDTYGCNFLADRKLRKAEPADEVKGIVARANLFMSDKYKVRLSKSQKALFEAWDKLFPPSQWEKEWARKVANQQGYENPYITRNTSLARN